jgi:hypothetical protein
MCAFGRDTRRLRCMLLDVRITSAQDAGQWRIGIDVCPENGRGGFDEFRLVERAEGAHRRGTREVPNRRAKPQNLSFFVTSVFFKRRLKRSGSCLFLYKKKKKTHHEHNALTLHPTRANAGRAVEPKVRRRGAFATAWWLLRRAQRSGVACGGEGERHWLTANLRFCRCPTALRSFCHDTQFYPVFNSGGDAHKHGAAFDCVC